MTLRVSVFRTEDDAEYFVYLINFKTYFCIYRWQNGVTQWKNRCDSVLSNFGSQRSTWKMNFLGKNKKIPTFGFLSEARFFGSTWRQYKRSFCNGFFQFKRLYFLSHLLFLVFGFFLFYPVFNWVGHQLKIAPEKHNVPLFTIIQFSLIWFQVKQDHLASQFLI